jgi:Mg2+-importing ATPase
MITKGALDNILQVCSHAESENGALVKIEEEKEKIQKIFKDYSNQGLRTLGVAYKNTGSDIRVSKDSESGMIFSGFLTFEDKPKEGIAETISDLKKLGVSLKIITGDNKAVAASIAIKAGLENPTVIIGSDLNQISDEALIKMVNDADVFAEVEPTQKERIIIALKKAGNVVGYMGDGINDASALHASDVSISVNSAADVAKQTADIVLLEKDLRVLSKGIKEGRVIFANTLKYIYMATSANFGNMFSMAGASLFLSFLPLLPKQILLTNLLTDFPEMTIATDNVDKEMSDVPRRFNMKFIRNFMLTFGLISSVFDYATFGILLLVMHANTIQFRTGWFLESVISASIIVLAIRTSRPIFKSRPGKYLLIATLIIISVTLSLPYTPLSTIFGFEPLPFTFILVLIAIVATYIIVVEAAKIIFYKKARY